MTQSADDEDRIARRRVQRRQHYAANAEKIKAWQRDYRAANVDKMNAQARARRAANPEHEHEVRRAWRLANAEKLAEQNRIRNARRDRAKSRASSMLRIHGITIAEWDEIWAAQAGKCYLCGDLLSAQPRQTVVEHDHDCCGPKKSCPACRRGLACARCNKIIGFARDNTALLRLVADNLDKATLQASRGAGPIPALEGLLCA